MIPDAEAVFTWAAPAVKFGPGAVDEIGYDVSQLGARRVLVMTDAGVAEAGTPSRVVAALRSEGLSVELFADVHVEPTDVSMQAAVDFARERGSWDGFVAVGGGSTIDTAKVVNLLTSCPGSLLDYVNRPVGGGRAPEGPLKPLVAVPTTAGTGAECTTVAVLDILSQKVKSGISHARLRPVLAVIDPTVTLSLPASVTAASGFDVLCHALESYTARPYSSYPRKAASERVAYCGANPISDLWIEHTLPLLARSFRTAVLSGDDVLARTEMHQAALYAGMGFGNAGVHVPHACAYPIAGRVRSFRPSGYPAGEPIVPHGMAVALTAPAAFGLLYPACSERQLWAAHVLDPSTDALPAESRLAEAVRRLMRDLGMPNGLSAVGYTSADVDGLVEGALQQQRLLSTAPVTIGADELAEVFGASLVLW